MIGRCKRCGKWFGWAHVKQWWRLRRRLGRHHPFKLPTLCGGCAIRAIMELGRGDA